MTGTNDLRRRSDKSLSELIEAAVREPAIRGALEALDLRDREAYEADLPALTELCARPEAPVRVRRAALLAVAGVGTAGARAALRESLVAPEPLLVRTALTGLGSVGEAEDLAAIAAADLAPQHARAGAWASSLIAYRTGAPGYEVAVPEAAAGLKLDKQESSLVLVRQPSPDEASQAAREARASAPGISLDAGRALELRCIGRRFLFLWNESSPSDPARYAARKRIVGVVARLFPEDANPDVWETQYVVLTHPRGRGGKAVDIAVTTRSGRLALHGYAELEGGEPRFDLRAADQPGAVPLEVRGRLVGGRLDLETVVTGLRHIGKQVPERTRGPVAPEDR